MVTHFLFHKPQLQYDTQSTPYPFSGEGIWDAIMKYIANLCQLTATTCSCCCYLSCFLYNHMFLCLPLSQPPLPEAKQHLYTDGRTDRHLLYAVYLDRRGCYWFCIIDPHDSWNVNCPLPCTSSPASWKLLSLLSVQDSSNNSSNDRHHHKLSSLDNNKTGILYLFPNVSLMFI